jgi:hypothetical protein
MIQDSTVDTDYKAIDSRTQMSDLDIICNTCTVFDSKSVMKVKQLMKYDARNERFVCQQCRKVVSEKQVRSVLNLNIEEYIYYEPSTPVRKTIQKRMDSENYVIKPNNPVPLNDPSRATRAIVINNREMKDKNRENKNEFGE